MDILKKFGIKAKKSLGQNFLLDHNILTQIVDYFEITGKHIIEVGPGYGALTEYLCKKSPASLDLVELDDNMIDILKKRIKSNDFGLHSSLLNLHHQDVLEFVPNAKSYSVIANIPYYITSPILRHFIYSVPHIPDSLLILMQKDVGEKILGGKKNKTSVLRLFIEKKYFVQKVVDVPKECFYPIPKVESVVLGFRKHEMFSSIDDSEFLSIIKIGFQENRKKLVNNFVKSGYNKEYIISVLKKMSYSENMRPEEGDINFWIGLLSQIQKK